MPRRPGRLATHLVVALLPALLQAVSFAGTDEPAPGTGSPRLMECRRIWDAAPHNAFTDLVRFKDRWVCVFREGDTHVAPDGKLRVIESADGKQWAPAALVSLAGA